MTDTGELTSTTKPAAVTPDRISTGVTGIDEILHGGLISTRSTLVHGPPGAGKTLFGLHYLTAGAGGDETGLFINMGEPERYILEDAASFGFDMDAVDFLDLRPDEAAFTGGESYDVFPEQEVEGPTLADDITTAINDLQPDRVFIDPLSQLRYLSDTPYQFRKQVMGLFRLLEETSTVFTSQATQATPDDDLQFMSDAVIHIDQSGEYRTISVSKIRGSGYHSGVHTLRITGDGMVVSPELLPDRHGRDFASGTLSSGVPELDSLMHGGIERGTVTLLSGPTGVGKTTTGLQFMKEGAGRGTNSVLYSFEENRRTLLSRAKAVNIPIREMIERDTFQITEISPGEMSVDEFAQTVRRDVEDNDAGIVMIDALDGYQNSLVGVDDIQEIAAISRYLRNMGVTTIIANEVHRVTGEFQVSEEKVSQLADNILILRHIEYQGELRKVIGVLKKRTSDFEQSLRELQITEHGVKVGNPLTGLRGVLTGTPDWNDGAGDSASIDTNGTDR